MGPDQVSSTSCSGRELAGRETASQIGNGSAMKSTWASEESENHTAKRLGGRQES